MALKNIPVKSLFKALQSYFVDEMLSDDLPQPRVELLSVLVEDHGVGVPVELLEAQAAVVLPLDLLDGVLQKVPDVVDVLLIHCHLQEVTRTQDDHHLSITRTRTQAAIVLPQWRMFKNTMNTSKFRIIATRQ